MTFQRCPVSRKDCIKQIVDQPAGQPRENILSRLPCMLSAVWKRQATKHIHIQQELPKRHSDSLQERKHYLLAVYLFTYNFIFSQFLFSLFFKLYFIKTYVFYYNLFTVLMCNVIILHPMVYVYIQLGRSFNDKQMFLQLDVFIIARCFVY